MELWKYYRKLYRRKWLIILGMVVCIGAAVAMAFLQKQEYTATATVMERNPGYGGANVFPDMVYTPVDPQLRLANLARMAYSNAVLERVAKALASEVTWDYQGLTRSLDVSPVRDTEMLRISVKNTDPRIAVDTARVFTDQFRDFYRELIYGPTRQKDYIASQVSFAKKQLEKKRAALEQYKVAHDVSDLDVEIQTKLQRLSDLEAQRRAAQVAADETSQRLASVQQEVNALPKTRQEQQTKGDNQLWLTLQTALVQQEQNLASMMVHRGPKHPDVIALEKSIADTKKQLTNEQRERIVQTVQAVNPVYSNTMDRYVQARVEAIGAQARLQALSAIVPQVKAGLASYPQNERELADLTFEEKTAEQTYALLKQKLDEATIRESEPYATGTIEVVDEPYLENPASNKMLKVALAIPVSILLSMLLIFLLDYLDNTLRTPEEAEDLLGLPVAAMVPLGKGHSLVRGLPDAGLRESYQMLSAALWYQHVQESGPGGVLVASAEPDAGRTVTAGNLAAALATDGARVILVDADLRKPAQHLVFGVGNARGLSNVLAGTAALEDVAVPTKTEGLLLVPSGPLPENPVRLLRNDTMRTFLEAALAAADFVVFDSPAGAAFADATVLASYIKRVLVVQSAGRVPRGAEREFRNRLEQVGAEFIGVVLNKVRPDDSHGVYHFRTAYASLPLGGQPPAGTVPPTSPAIPS